MRPEAFTTIDLTIEPKDGPIHTLQTYGPGSQISGSTALAVLAVMIAAPQIALAGYAIFSPEVRTVVANNPVIAVQLAVALTFWTGLLIIPARRMVRNFTRQRRVSIANRQVDVEDVATFATVRWREPLDAYTGVAHHVRSSISGARHELVLVHPDSRRSILLGVDATISKDDLATMAARLNLPEADPGLLYRLPRRRLPRRYAAARSSLALDSAVAA